MFSFSNIDEVYTIIKELDDNDGLASYKAQFVETENVIYLDGNSLGKLPLATKERLQHVIDHEWGQRMIRSWNESWLKIAERLRRKIAVIIGARPHEIFIGDSTSINLYKLAFAALKSRPSRSKVVIDENNFPTDHYILQGLKRDVFSSMEISILEGGDYGQASQSKIEDILDDQTAFLCMSHVLYKSGYLYDMAKIQTSLKKCDVYSLWDLSHSAGVVQIELNKWGIDMAVGCTYKYLNGGPGAPSFLYIREDLQNKLFNPITAWFGHKNPFEFSTEFRSAAGIEKFGTGTPSILSLAAIEGGLDIIIDAGIDKIRAKSIAQTSLLIDLAKKFLEPLGCFIITPSNQDRGSHVSLSHPESYRICQAMISPQDNKRPLIIPDFRPPSYIRLGIAPLYVSYEEIFQAVLSIKEIIETEEFLLFNTEIEGVS